jgi:cytochrome c oxidase subunit 2
MPGVFPAMIGSNVTHGPAADHLNIVSNGHGGMPAFKMLSDSELASVITYERRSFGNNRSVVQPSDVTSAR